MCCILPTSPAIPTIFGGCGKNGSDFDFSPAMTTVCDFLVVVWTPMKAEAVIIAERPTTIWSIMMDMVVAVWLSFNWRINDRLLQSTDVEMIDRVRIQFRDYWHERFTSMSLIILPIATFVPISVRKSVINPHNSVPFLFSRVGNSIRNSVLFSCGGLQNLLWFLPYISSSSTMTQLRKHIRYENEMTVTTEDRPL